MKSFLFLIGFLPFMSTAFATEKAVLFIPLQLQQRIDVIRLQQILKLPSNGLLKEGSSDTLEKVLTARQDSSSRAALERITNLSVDLVRTRDKKSEDQKIKGLEEIESITQAALAHGWHGPFAAIRHFTFGLVKQEEHTIRLLLANSEDLPPQLPNALRETVDLHKAEWLAEIVKTNRNAMHTKIIIENGTDWPRAHYCLYKLNGQPFTELTNLVIAGAQHQLIETCANGSQRAVTFELKPFQREAIIFFPDATINFFPKISEQNWNSKVASLDIQRVVVVESLNRSTLMISSETKDKITQRNIALSHVKNFEKNVEQSYLAANAINFEMYPSFWIGAGTNSEFFVENLPKGQFLGISFAVRHSDFMLSLDSGFVGFNDVDTALWLFPRVHWSSEFSLNAFRGIELRPLLGTGVFLLPESADYENIPFEEKLYGSAGLILSYKISEKTFLSLGSETNFSITDFTNRLIGLSLRIGYDF